MTRTIVRVFGAAGLVASLCTSCMRIQPGHATAGPVVLRQWDFEQDAGGWTAAHQVRPLEVVDGLLVTGAAGRDPFIQTDPTVDLDLPVTDRTGFILRMRNTGKPTADLYGFVQDPKYPDKLKVYSFHRFTTIPDGTWHTYRLYPFWNADLKSVRIDIPDGSDVAIDSLRVVQSPVPDRHLDDADWDFRRGTGGWVLFEGETDVVATAGGLRVRTPALLVSGALELPAEDYRSLSIEASSSARVKGALYWGWTHDSWLPGHFVRTFDLEAGTNRVELELAMTPAYDGVVKRLFLSLWSDNGAETTLHRLVLSGEAVAEAQTRQDPAGETPAAPGASRPPDTDRATPPTIGNERVELALVAQDGACSGAQLTLLDGSKRRLMGTLPHLGAILPDADETDWIPLRHDQVATPRFPDRSVLIVSGTTDIGDARFTNTVRLSVSPGNPWIDVQCEVRSDRDVRVRGIRGPWLWAGEGSFGEAKDIGLYPGNEYLGPNEPSGNPRVAALPTCIRTVRHPYSITIPSACIEHDGDIVGLMWNPRQHWSGGHAHPSFAFDSPNRVEDRANHLLGLFAPGVPDPVPVNRLSAPEGWALEAGVPVSLSGSLFARADVDATHCIDLWLDRFGLPGLPEPPRSHREAVELSMRSYEDLLWSEVHGRWAGWAGVPARNCDPTLSYLVAADAVGDPTWGQALRRKGLALSDASRLDLALFSGRDPAPALSRELVRARLDAEAIPADGRIPFAPRRMTDGRSGLGHPNESNSGLCFAKALRLLKRARATGSPEALQAAERVLQHATRYRVPRGSQTWEVPMACPDIFASANGCEAYLIAHGLTGNADYLAQAVHWARTGLPFVYLWQADAGPPFMKGASLAVYGTSMFRGTGWYTRPVQWCGLAYARVLLRLADIDRSMPWRHIAEMCVISALHQQSTAPADFGCYPDAWHLVTGEKSSIMINPGRLLIPTLELIGHPMEPTFRTARLGDDSPVVCLASAGRLGPVVGSGDRLSLSLRSTGSAPFSTAITGISQPTGVALEGELLPQLCETDEGPGWRYVDGLACIALHLEPAAEPRRLVIEGVRAIPAVPLPPVWEFDGNQLGGWAANLKLVRRLRTETGCLVARTARPGGFLVTSPFALRADTCPALALRLRSTVPSLVLHYSTEPTGFEEAHSAPIAMPANGEFHEIALPMAGRKGWTGTIRRFRLWIGEHPARVDIDWIRPLGEAAGGD